MMPKIGLLRFVPRVVCAWAVAIAFALPAHSQTVAVGNIIDQVDSPADDDSVLGRPRPEYDPQGVPLGAFRAYPSLSVFALYDNNVLRTKSDQEDDALFEITPQLSLRSQWSQHYLGLNASATRYQYSSVSSEDRTEWNILGTGRLDILTGVIFAATLQDHSTVESRTSRDQIGAAEPTPYNQADARFVFSYNPYRLGLQLAGQFQRLDFGATKLLPSFGGGELDNEDRNYNDYSIVATALYELSPGYAVFVRPTYDTLKYDHDFGRAVGRNSQGYRIETGVNLLLSQLIKGEVYAGYINRNFDGANFVDLSGIDFGAALRWYPTELITVRLNASRTPTPTTLPGASVADERNIALGVDYEVLRNVILQGAVNYTSTALDGITRHDHDFSTQVGVRYLVNPYLTANAVITHASRDTNATGAGYVYNVVSIGLTAHL